MQGALNNWSGKNLVTDLTGTEQWLEYTQAKIVLYAENSWENKPSIHCMIRTLIILKKFGNFKKADMANKQTRVTYIFNSLTICFLLK